MNILAYDKKHSMKIHPPKAIIDADNPFDHALFGRKEFAESLTALLRNVSEGVVVFVNAPWGEGKTTFAQMWRSYLQKQKLEVIYFDAYAADYFDDPFVSFSGEILELVEKSLKDKGLNERREFKKTAIEVGKKLAGLAAKVGIRAATMGAMTAADLEEFKEAGSEIAKGVSEIGADIIEKKIENYTKEKDALTIFKKSLAKLAAVVRAEQGFPLTIIVDELDRCRPDFALNLLERIKHLFDVEGVAFVLLVNQEQIESYVRTVYGETVDAAAYLLKFANLFVDLPSRQLAGAFQYEKNRKDYCEILAGHYGLSSKVKDLRHLLNISGVFVEHFNLTLREIEKAFAATTLYYGSLSATEENFEFLVILLSILKVKVPSVYEPLSLGQMSMDEFFKNVKFDQIKWGHSQSMNPEWFKDWLRVWLMSDDEFQSASFSPDGTPTNRFSKFDNWQYGRNRSRVIPLHCDRLDRFSFRPGSA